MRASETAAEAVRRYKNAVNNAQGHSFEGYIKAACALYSQQGRAEIDKTPEPFRVTAKDRKNGTFSGRFTARAQPDFQGTLDGERSIVFEAKYTTTDRMKRAAVTDEQMKCLQTLSFINLKGGVGKTISAANVAHILATVHGKRVLLVDGDKQGKVAKLENQQKHGGRNRMIRIVPRDL